MRIPAHDFPAWFGKRTAAATVSSGERGTDIICARGRELMPHQQRVDYSLLILIEFPRNRNELVHGRHKSHSALPTLGLYYHRYRVAP